MPKAEREGRGLTLMERIEAWRRAGRPAGDPTRQAEAKAVVERWRRLIAAGDAAIFEARLSWDGLVPADVIRALSWAAGDPAAAARWSVEAALSGELETMFDAGRARIDGGGDQRRVERGRDAGLGFIELWAPWLAQLAALLESSPAYARGVVAPAAVDTLVDHVARQVADLAAEAAFRQFDRRRSAELSVLADRSGDAFYRRWIDHQIERRLTPLFDEYPVLERQLERLLQTSAGAALELVERLARDRTAVADLLGSTTGLGPAVEIRPGLSDRHHGGRRVAVVIFAGGERVVYKPRSLAVEVAFAELVGWCADEGLKQVPTFPPVLERDGYGWMGYVEAPSFESASAVSSWFEAAGALLCLGHLLGASDLHFDNLLVGAASPAAIDLETVLHPYPVGRESAAGGATATARVAEWMRSSFHATGMLSFLQEGPDGSIIDIGGLCGAGGHDLGESVVEWRDLGRDGLHRVTRASRARTRRNVPVLDGRPAAVADHLAELQSGFSRAYRFVLERRSTGLTAERVRRRFERASSRVLLRPTEQYARVLRLLLSPACQRDGVAAGLAVEALNRGLIEAGRRPALWPVVEAERRDLTGLDIPRFTTAVGDSVLRAPDGSGIADVIARSGIEIYEERVAGFSDDDLDRQVRLMTLTTESLRDSVGHVDGADRVVDAAADPDAVGPLGRDALLEEARALADRLSASAVAGDDGSLTWLDPVHLRPEGRHDRGVAHYLYSGSSGIGLFMAAAATVFPGRGYRRTAAGALRPVLTAARSPELPALLADEGLGACHGLGGLIYVLSRVAEWLDDDGSFEAARKLAACVDGERLAADRALDVEGGAAGAIFGLLALHEQTADEQVLEAARACGRHLLETRRPGPVGGAAWPSRQGGMLAGFAHGASGIALALTRLWRAAGDESLLRAAGDALVFENTRFDPATRNWPVLLHDDDGAERERRNMTAWCHGAPGIALARAEIGDVLAEANDGGRLDVAVATTLAAPATGPDHLCCGTLGRVDIVHTLGRLMKRDEFRRVAWSRASMVIRRAAGRGDFRLDGNPEIARPGFFRGLAGIGYVLLRLAAVKTLPSVLAFQSASTKGDRP